MALYYTHEIYEKLFPRENVNTFSLKRVGFKGRLLVSVIVVYISYMIHIMWELLVVRENMTFVFFAWCLLVSGNFGTINLLFFCNSSSSYHIDGIISGPELAKRAAV